MSHSTDRYRVLVTEDDKNLLHTLCEMVDVAGFQVTAASNGQEAWNLFQTEHIDIVLTDIQMPVMDGFELIESIRSHYDMVEKYIIAISGNDKSEMIVQALNIGANDFIRKPFSVIEVIARLQSAARTLTSARRLANQSREDALHDDGAFFTIPGEHLTHQYQKEMSRAARHGRDISCVVMAIQNMPEFISENSDTLKTQWFKHLHSGLLEMLRSHDIVGKYTDSQIGIILPETRCEQAQIVRNKIEEYLEAGKLGIAELKTRPAITFGVAGYDVATRSNHVLERASKATGNSDSHDN